MFDTRQEDFIDEMLHVIVWPLLLIIAAGVLSGIGSFIFQHEFRNGILYLLGAGVAYILVQGINRYFDLKEHTRKKAHEEDVKKILNEAKLRK
jgi:positive regulator of sigma E activity